MQVCLPSPISVNIPEWYTLLTTKATLDLLDIYARALGPAALGLGNILSGPCDHGITIK